MSHTEIGIYIIAISFVSIVIASAIYKIYHYDKLKDRCTFFENIAKITNNMLNSYNFIKEHESTSIKLSVCGNNMDEFEQNKKMMEQYRMQFESCINQLNQLLGKE